MAYLSRLTLQPNAAKSRAFWDNISQVGDGHRLVWRWFAQKQGAPRDFLFRLDTTGRVPTILTLSARPPVVDAAVWQAEVRGFAPNLHAGQRLQFNVRVSPTRKKTLGERADGKRRAGRVDVVMDAIKELRARDGGDVRIDRETLALDEGRGWLKRREEQLGVKFLGESVQTSRYQQVVRPRSRRPAMRFSTLDLEGLLLVTDPEQFVARVLGGVGPQKGFGCGLMLLRPAP